MNFKQEQLIGEFLAQIQARFPEVEFLNVSENPENPNDLWLNVTAPDDEDREEELLDFTADRGTDILLEYGYLITVMPRRAKAYLEKYLQPQDSNVVDKFVSQPEMVTA